MRYSHFVRLAGAHSGRELVLAPLGSLGYNERAMVAPSSNIPTIFAAFGATGDLMRRKVLPALYYLYKHDELPKMFKVVGFSRREWNDEKFRGYVREVLE